ncbi:MAG: trypsin-like peptidase domain-containing protein [Methylotenera sp.]|nr:trypsin-like peptidase domain-containing protein [Oligoflexia bacterium]
MVNRITVSLAVSVVSLLSGSSVWASGGIHATVIYGEDTRKDLYDVTSSLELKLADSTTAVMKASDLTSSGAKTRIASHNFGEEFQLCEDEPFRDQPTAAFCSASLVAPDLMMTAGHCVVDQDACKQTRFVFGFNVKTRGKYPSEVKTSDVYSCKSIVRREQVEAGPDYALIRLDRPVKGHVPLEISRAGNLSKGDEIMVIGHPSGIPTKVAGGAHVRDPNPSGYFVANLNTYGGNSGSAVFNSVTGRVEGILVRGERDFVQRDSCNVSNHCPLDGCRGEDVTKIANVADLIPENR